ncbi:hypothetical protein F8B60_10355, partial [Glaesserella parasuis]|uniref:hypothetical protein n=1 Tax=Glaesserella parasuis TaxID=738 RepID=UPI0013290DAC
DYFLDKQQDKFKLSLLSLVLLGIFFSPPAGSAAYFAGGASASGNGSDDGTIGIGQGSKASYGAIAIGQLAKAKARHNIAIGYDANTGTHNNSITIGYNTKVSGEQGIAIGKESKAGGRSVVLGGQAEGTTTQTVVIGNLAKATGSQSIAIGADTKAEGYGSISIGGDDLDQTDYHANNANNANNGSSRRTTTAKGKASVAIGGLSLATGDGSIVVGPLASASDVEGIAIGARSKSTAEYGIAVGGSATAGKNAVAVGRESNGAGTDSIAIGNSAKTTGADSVVVGANINVTGEKLVAIGREASAKSRSTALGYKASAGGMHSVAVGESAMINDAAARATALGNNTVVTVGGGVALGYGSRAETQGGIEGAKQTYSVTTGTSTDANGFKSTQIVDNNAIGAVSVGNDNIKRQIVNVAAGKQDTDAVNVAQLKSLTMKIAGNTGNSDNEKVGIWEGTLKVLGTNGEISTSASNDTITLKLDEALKKKITDSASTEYVDNKFNNVKVTGGGQEFTVGDGATNTTKITVNTEQDKKHFDIVGKDGITTSVNNRKVEVTLSNETKTKIDKIDNLETKVNTQGITFKGNTGQTDSIKLGDTLKVEGVTGETEVMASTDKLALGLAKKVKDEIAGKMSSFKIKANSEANEETISNDNTIVFKNGKNINVTRSNKELIFATVATPEFTSVQYGNNGPKITSTGGNLKVTGADGNTPVKITNVAEGTEINDAVNKGQLDNATVTYFHTNTGETTQGEGDENTNKGKITDKAGARGKHSVTAGVNAKAEGENSIAIGYEAKISAQNAVAIGANSKAGSHSAALGYKAQALGRSSVAVGESAMINDGAARATALGNNTVVTVGGGVALGYGSNADRAGDIEGAKQSYSVTVASSVDNGFKSTGSVDNNPIGAVSVGNVRIKRQITNVAAGKELTDAVNVAQLKSLTMKIGGDSNENNPKVGIWNGKLEVKGTNEEIKTKADGSTITISLEEKIRQQLAQIATKMSSFKIKTDKDNNEVTINDGNTIQFTAGDNIKITHNNKNLNFAVTSGMFASTTDGRLSKQTDGLATVNDVVSAVNSAGWKLAIVQGMAGQATPPTAHLIKMGDTVKFTAGDNIKLTQENGNITIATKGKLIESVVNETNGDVKITYTDGTHNIIKKGEKGIPGP